MAALGRRDLRPRGRRHHRRRAPRRHDVRAPERAARPDPRRHGRRRQERHRVRVRDSCSPRCSCRSSGASPTPWRRSSTARPTARAGRCSTSPATSRRPRPKEELVRRDRPAASRRVSTSCPARSSSWRTADAGLPRARLLAERSESEEVWRLRGVAPSARERLRPRSCTSTRWATGPSSRCGRGGKLAGALGVGHKDGRVPLSTEDEALLKAVMAQAGLAYENARLYGALADRLEEIRALQKYQESVIQSSSSGIVVLDGRGPRPLGQPRVRAARRQERGGARGLTFADVLPGVTLGDAARGRRRVALRGAVHRRRRRRARPARLGVAPPGRARPARRARRRRDRPAEDGAGARRARAPRLPRHPRGGRRARGQHADRGPVLVRAAAARGDLARRPALRDPEEDGAPDLPRGAPRQQPPRVRPAASRAQRRGRTCAPCSRTPRSPSRRPSAAAGSTLSRQRPAIAVEVVGDARELEQVFVNLLTNARDASPEGGDRRPARLERDGDVARVDDRRPRAGLAAGAGDRLFQPFYTTKKSGRHGPRPRHLPGHRPPPRRRDRPRRRARAAAPWRGSTLPLARRGGEERPS